MWVLLPILLFVAALAYKLKDNFEKWKIGAPVDHKKEAIQLLPVLIPAAVLFCAMANSWWSVAVVPFMIGVWWNTLFDGFYNLVRRMWRKKYNQIYKHLTWWYTGTDDEDDANTDDFYQRNPEWLHKTIKIGGCIVTTTIYILIYLKNQ